MRVAYGIALVATITFVQAVAMPADMSWLLHAALVAACIVLGILFLWVTVGPRARRPLLLRTAGLAVGSVACGLRLAGSGAFDPPRRELETPSEVPTLSDTADVLRTAGYAEAAVTYPMNTSDTVLVR